MSGIVSLLKKIGLIVINRMAPVEDQEDNSLIYWRVRILFAIIFSALLFASAAIVASFFIAVNQGLWFMFGLNVGSYFLAFYLLTTRRLHYKIRTAVVLAMAYFVGLYVTLGVGPLSGGPIWLFGFAILIGVMYGAKLAAGALALNAATLVLVAYLIKSGYYPPEVPLFSSDTVMFSAMVNFLVVNTITAMSVAVLVRGMIVLHKKDRELSQSLHTEREQLIAAKRSLEKEIAERIHAEAEAKELSQKLQRAEKMEALGQLAGGVAHDLNNVLSGLVSYPDLVLFKLPKDSDMRQPLLRIKSSGENAAAIVRDLLALARRGVTMDEVIDVNDVVERYLASNEHGKLTMANPHCELVTDLTVDLLNVKGSQFHISKTVMNLVRNAVEAMEHGGVVTIATRNIYVEEPLNRYETIAPGEYCLLSVVDTGQGIAHDDLEHIFEPFYTKKQMGRSGTGLGLSVVWSTVKDYGGFIDVRTSSDEGTTFDIYLPATREKLQAAEMLQDLDQYQGQGQLVLVVDDLAVQTEIACNILDSFGYRTAAVNSGKAALEFFSSVKPDLVLLDMIMPDGWDGLDTFMKILEVAPGQKAVIASGYSETDRVRQALRLGVSDYLPKPYTIESLVAAVWKALN